MESGTDAPVDSNVPRFLYSDFMSAGGEGSVGTTMAPGKDKRNTFARPVLKLEKHPQPGTGGANLSRLGPTQAEFETNIQRIIGQFPAIGKGSGLTDKVVLVGDQNVGKTCLVLRYCEDSFWE